MRRKAEQGYKRRKALDLLVEAGVLERCGLHIDNGFLGPAPITAGIDLAMARKRTGELSVFQTEAEIEACLQEVFATSASTVCPICESITKRKDK